MNAIEKINAEMQKDPTNLEYEDIGHYIIDRCTDPEINQKIGADASLTLKGCMKHLESVAKKKAKGGRYHMRPEESFRLIDEYFGLAPDKDAQLRALLGDATAKIPVPYKTAPEPAAKSATSKLSLDDFL